VTGLAERHGDERVRRMTWKLSMRQGPVDLTMDITADATDLALQQMEQAQP
jgi:hypothetical protein